MGATPTDQALVRQARRGTPERRKRAFAQLVSRYERLTRSLLYSLSGDAALAEDLAQETFLNAWLKLADLKQPQAFAGWLKQMAYRQFLHHVRRREIERKHLPDREEAIYTPALPVDDELNQLLGLCTPVERELMILCYGFGLTHAEIGAARAMPVGTVKSHIHRARQKIQAWSAEQTSAENREAIENHG